MGGMLVHITQRTRAGEQVRLLALQPSHMQLDNTTSTGVHRHTRAHKRTPHLMTPSFQRNGAILNCMLLTGICKLSKLQMIACSLPWHTTAESAIKSTISQSCLYAKKPERLNKPGIHSSCLSLRFVLNKSAEG